MAKDLQWFKFSPLNWMTGRIRKETPKVQIAFVEIMCQYWKNSCVMTFEQAELEIGESLTVLLKRKLVKQEGENIRIQFLDEQMGSIEETSAQKSYAAKSRWSKVQSKTMHVHKDALHVHDSAMQNDADKIRQEKTRQDEITRDLFADQIFLERIGTANRGKDLRQAFHDCYAYHANGSEIELGEWKKKFVSWLTRVRPTDGHKNKYKVQ